MAGRFRVWIETIFSPATTQAKNALEFERLRLQAVELERDNLKTELKRIHAETRKEYQADVKRLMAAHNLELERFRQREEHLLNLVIVQKGGNPLPDAPALDAGENNDLYDGIVPNADEEHLLRIRAKQILQTVDSVEEPTKAQIESQFQIMVNDPRGLDYWLT